MQDFSVEMKKILDIENKKDIETFIKEKYGVALKQEDFPHLNLYNFIEYYIHEFSVKDKETDFLIQEQKVPNQRWYRNKALSFQYGFDVETDTDVFKKTIQVDGVDIEATEEQIEAELASWKSKKEAESEKKNKVKKTNKEAEKLEGTTEVKGASSEVSA